MNASARSVTASKRSFFTRLATSPSAFSCQIGRKAYQTGDVSRGMLSAGHALGLTDRIEPMADIIARIEAEARDAFGALQGKAAVPQAAQ